MATHHCLRFVLIILISISLKLCIAINEKNAANILSKVFSSPGRNSNGNSTTCDGKCYPEIGCMPAVEKCLSVAFGRCSDPDSLENINSKFMFFSKRNQYDPHLLNSTLSDSEIKNIPFNKTLLTVVLVHGYEDKYTENTSLGPIKNLYLNKMEEGANIIAIDWTKGAANPNFQTAKANAKVVGAQIALLIEKLDKIFQVNTDKMMLIGFSLGGQVVAYAAEFTFRRLNRKIDRIIGLDAAGLCYDDRIFWYHDSEGLNPNHAALVEAVHTNAATLGYGYRGKEGHYDYYPNGGDHQPGCVTLTVILSAGFEKSYCSHMRKQDLYFMDYERFGECQPVAYNCSNYEQFEKGFCASCEKNECQLMALGIQVSKQELMPAVPQKSNFKLYLKTLAKSPFCMFHFQVKATLKVGYKPNTLEITLISETRNETVKLTAGPENKYYSLLTIAETKKLYKAPSFKSAILLDYFVENNKVINVIEKLEVLYMSHICLSVRSSHSTILCPTSDNILQPCSPP